MQYINKKEGRLLKRTIMLLCAAMLFLAGYLCRTPQKAEPVPEPVPVRGSAASVPEEGYRLAAEDGYLNLYRCGGDEKLIASEKIDLSLFPPRDEASLKKGIEFSDEEEAFSAFEDYIG